MADALRERREIEAARNRAFVKSESGNDPGHYRIVQHVLNWVLNPPTDSPTMVLDTPQNLLWLDDLLQ